MYNIETAMPRIDLDAIESHLRAAREEERRVSNKQLLIPVCFTERLGLRVVPDT